jgi:Uma2 family endonuclease
MENEVKEPAPKYNYISPEEYLEMERASEEKHEYYDGYVVSMSGASKEHNFITVNLLREISSFLKGQKCRILPSNMRVCTPGSDAYIYPDASIVCDELELEDDKFDTLLNPSVVFEILSPSTQKNDRGYTLLYYQNIPSLQQYVMIDSKRKHVQSVVKQPDGDWRFENISATTTRLTIPAINFSISLDDIYYDTGL